MFFFFFSSRRRHTRYIGDWSSDVCSSDLCGCRRTIRRKSFPASIAARPACWCPMSRRWKKRARSRLRRAIAAGEIGRASCRKEGRERGAGGREEERDERETGREDAKNRQR